MSAAAAGGGSPAPATSRRREPGFFRALSIVAGLEFGRAFHRRRLLFLNILIPLAVTTPIALSAAPAPHAIAVYAVQFILFGTFGAAIPALRDAETGIMSRLQATCLGAAPLLLARAGAGAAIDLLELLPALAVILAVGHAGPAFWLDLPLLLLGSLFIANITGIWIAAIARSIAEGALFAAVAALLLLHASGTFRTPSPGSIGAGIERIAPYRALHEALLAAGAHASAPDPMPLAVAVPVTAIITAITARLCLRSLAATESR